MKCAALIFDFDGVITDTEPVHMESWLSVLEMEGITFDEDEYHNHYIGLNDRDFLDVLGKIHGRYFSDEEKANLIEQKANANIRLLEQNIPLLPGVSDFIIKANKKFLMAICSGANRGEIEFILRHLKWTGMFNPIIASDSVKRGKPDPEGYIRALEGLCERSGDMILAEQAIAIEDSPKGIAAAKAAGLRCIAVGNSFSKDDLTGADLIVDSLADVEIEKL